MQLKIDAWIIHTSSYQCEANFASSSFESCPVFHPLCRKKCCEGIFEVLFFFSISRNSDVQFSSNHSTVKHFFYFTHLPCKVNMSHVDISKGIEWKGVISKNIVLCCLPLLWKVNSLHHKQLSINQIFKHKAGNVYIWKEKQSKIIFIMIHHSTESIYFIIFW